MHKLLAMMMLCLALGACGRGADPNANLDRGRVELGGKTYQVEIAQTPEQATHGLMNRTSLAPDAGMLFIFEEESELWFWMKDTLIPLDILFFDSEGQLVRQFVNVPPCKADPCPYYKSQGAARYVLEVNAGLTEGMDPNARLVVGANDDL